MYEGPKHEMAEGSYDKKSKGEGNGFGEHDPRHPDNANPSKKVSPFGEHGDKKTDNSLMKGKMNPFN